MDLIRANSGIFYKVKPMKIRKHEKIFVCRPPRPDQMVEGTNYGMFNDLGVYGVPRLVRERKR